MIRSRTSMRCCCLLLLIAGFDTMTQAELISQQELGFSFELPNGFRPRPEIAQKKSGILFAYVDGETEADEIPIGLLIERHRGVVSRERLRKETMPREFIGDISRIPWQGFELDCTEVPEVLRSVNCLTFNLQVPLEANPVHVRVFGPEVHRKKMQMLLRNVMATFQGKSNWIPSAFPFTESLMESELRWSLMLGGFIVVAIAVFVSFLRMSRQSNRGKVLGLGVILCFIGIVIEQQPGLNYREMKLLIGFLYLVGVEGILVGLYDLFRSRPPELSANPSAKTLITPEDDRGR